MLLLLYAILLVTSLLGKMQESLRGRHEWQYAVNGFKWPQSYGVKLLLDILSQIVGILPLLG